MSGSPSLRRGSSGVVMAAIIRRRGGLENNRVSQLIAVLIAATVTVTQKGGPASRPRCHLLSRHRNTPT
jgi:hypothetical protein